jgi:hypothetical protein
MSTFALGVRKAAVASVLVLTVGITGCYRATVETGRPASGQQVQNQWAHAFISGLVPPATVNTAAQCPNGVARVETQLSFLNMLVGAITFGIYTPMTITVDCAAPGAAMLPTDAQQARVITLPEGATRADLAQALDVAATRSKEINEPVFVAFPALE